MKLILTGGFLGSGKTTAIVNASQLLIQRGKKVAVITNDQGDQQVDSAFVKSFGIKTKEVSEGCFCCQYEELENHLQLLEAQDHPDIIFAESVGSCADLVATIVKPLNKFKPEIKIIVPVFADASILSALIEGRSLFLDESVRYIYKKQLEEADLLVINKTDLLTPEQLAAVDNVVRCDYAGKTILHQNSCDHQDVSKWLDLLDSFDCRKKRNSLTLDYDIYGAGESRLAWLDKSIVVDAPYGNGIFAVRHLVRSIFNRLRIGEVIIGHLKFLIETDHWKEKISFTAASTAADIKVKDDEVKYLRLLINARVQTDPQTLGKLVDEVLTDVQQTFRCAIVTEKFSAFTPGYPRPTHRVS
jgi:G3E family GTPase